MDKEGPLDDHDRDLITSIALRSRLENAEVDRASALRLAEARIEARRLASLIAELPGVRRVLLFGSSASGYNFNTHSDIDLAMEGGDSWVAMDIVEDSSFKVDLVSLETIHPVMRRRIEKEGIQLYEKTTADYERLIEELDDDMVILGDLFKKNRRAEGRILAGAQDELDWAALGYTIHNLYCCFESYFLRIAKFFENGLDPSTWHAELLGRMTLELPTTRPRLFDKAYARRMDELRKFRHAFRNVYQDGLDPLKLMPLNALIPALLEDFQPFHERFRALLVALKDETDNSGAGR